jgi:hypothetical protein
LADKVVQIKDLLKTYPQNFPQRDAKTYPITSDFSLKSGAVAQKGNGVMPEGTTPWLKQVTLRSEPWEQPAWWPERLLRQPEEPERRTWRCRHPRWPW